MPNEPKCIVCRQRPKLDREAHCEICWHQYKRHIQISINTAKHVWTVADKQIAALQAHIAELEAQLANTLEARAARTKQPWPARLLLECAAKHPDLYTREDFDRMLTEVKGEPPKPCDGARIVESVPQVDPELAAALEQAEEPEPCQTCVANLGYTDPKHHPEWESREQPAPDASLQDYARGGKTQRFQEARIEALENKVANLIEAHQQTAKRIKAIEIWNGLR